MIQPRSVITVFVEREHALPSLGRSIKTKPTFICDRRVRTSRINTRARVDQIFAAALERT